MPKVIVTHAVVDLDRWLKGKAERASLLAEYATNVTEHVAADGSNRVAIFADVFDVGALQVLKVPRTRGTPVEERHGVIQPMTVYVQK